MESEAWDDGLLKELCQQRNPKPLRKFCKAYLNKIILRHYQYLPVHPDIVTKLSSAYVIYKNSILNYHISNLEVCNITGMPIRDDLYTQIRKRLLEMKEVDVLISAWTSPNTKYEFCK